MKFIKLESRGGNYLVVAENVAWLRSAENGQTNVGIVGGQPLLVVGTIEEVAAKILAGAGTDDAAPAPAPVPDSEAERPARPSPAPKAKALAETQAPPAAPPPFEPEPEREMIAEAASEPAPLAAAPAPAPEPEPEPTPEPVTAPEAPRAARKPMTLSERLAAAAASPKVKTGSQRMMGMHE